MLRDGTGTATEYRHGAAIRTTITGSALISPLRLSLVTSPALPVPGDKAQITLTVSNSGAAPLAALKAVLAVASGSVYAGPVVGPTPPGPVTVNPNGVVVFNWTVTIGGTGSISVSALVTATVTGQGFVSAESTRVLTPPGLPRFSASLAPNPVRIFAGQWFRVVVTVSNTGGVRAREVLPASSPSGNANLVAFKAGPEPAKPVTLEPGDSAGFTFTYSANGSGTVSFTATVSGVADLTPPGLASRAAVTAVEKANAAAAWYQETRATSTAWIDRTFNPPKPPPPTERPFMTFEKPKDLTWETDGYAALALSSTRMTEGDHAAAVTFSVPGDLTLTPTGAFKPAIRLVWPPRGQEHALAPRDWTPFRSFRGDFFNASPAPLALSFTLIDNRGDRYEDLHTLAAMSATTLQWDLQPVREARVDISRLSTLEFAIDTTSLKARPVLSIDNLRFELPPPPPPKRAALSATTMLSSTVAAEPVLAPAGAAKGAP